MLEEPTGRFHRIAGNRHLRKSLVVVSFLAISLLLFTKIFTSDYGIHLSVGRYVLENMKIPHTEFLIYPLQGQAMNFEEIGFQVLLYSVYRAFGSYGVSVFIWSLACLSFVFLYKALRAREVRPAIILLTMLLFAFPFRIRLQPRPEVVAYLFSSFLIYGLSLFYYRDNRKIIYTFPVLFFLWANIHPSTIMGLGIIGVYGTQSIVIAIREKFRTETMKQYLYIPILVFGLCVLGSMMSKHGLDSILTPLRIIANPTIKQNTSELVSIRQSSFYLPYKFLLIPTVAFGLLAAMSFRLRLHDAILGAYGFRLSLQVARGMAFMGLFAIPLVAQSVDSVLKKLEELIRERKAIAAARELGRRRDTGKSGKKRKRNAGGAREEKLRESSAGGGNPGPWKAAHLAVSIAFVLSTTLGSFYLYYRTYGVVESGIGITEHKFSFQATEFLRPLDIQGNMFNFFDLGGFLDWQLHPDKLTFIDGRGGSEQLFWEHQVVTSGMEGLEKIFAKYNITYVVTKAADSGGSVLPLIRILTNSPQWELVFADGLALVYMKNIPENRDIIAKYRLPKQRINEHIVHELIHYTYLGVSKEVVYSIVSNIYRNQKDYQAAEKFREYAVRMASPPAIIRAIDWVLS